MAAMVATVAEVVTAVTVVTVAVAAITAAAATAAEAAAAAAAGGAAVAFGGAAALASGSDGATEKALAPNKLRQLRYVAGYSSSVSSSMVPWWWEGCVGRDYIELLRSCKAANDPAYRAE